MGPSATIKSTHDGTILELCDRSGGYFSARLAGPNFQGAAKVYEYKLADLKAFFADSAAQWKGWSGKKEWSSLDGELSMSATIDSTGHISMCIEMRSGHYPFHWRLCSVLLLEAGQLDSIAASISDFVGDGGAELG